MSSSPFGLGLYKTFTLGNSGMNKIQIKYPAILVTEKGDQVRNYSILIKCIGKRDEAELYKYLNDDLLDLGITSGSVEIVSGDTKNSIYSLVTYQSPKKLNKSQLDSLIEETNGQMTDGFGEQVWDLQVESRNYFICLCSSLSGIPLSTEQIESNAKTIKVRCSPIFSAIKKHEIEKIRKYYKQEHFEQFCQFGSPPLWHAISEELHAIAIEMINAGAPVIFDKASLLSACAMNHSHDYPKLIELAELIINKGADVNQAEVAEPYYSTNGYTALMWAANRGKKPLVEMLMKYGADVNRQSENGATALTSTAPESLDIVRLLLEAGANPHLLDSQQRNAVSESLWQADSWERHGGDYGNNRANLCRKKATLIQEYM